MLQAFSCICLVDKFYKVKGLIYYQIYLRGEGFVGLSGGINSIALMMAQLSLRPEGQGPTNLAIPIVSILKYSYKT